jgi:hypothetical protein
MFQYLNHGTFYTSGQDGCGRTGNTTAKITKIPHTKELWNQVHVYIRNKQKSQQNERVTTKQILQYFVESGVISIPVDDHGNMIDKDYKAAYKNVYRWLQKEK